MSTYLGITTNTQRASELLSEGMRSEKILGLLKEVGASTYIAVDGAKSYMMEDGFEEFFPGGIAGNTYLKALRFATGFRLSRGSILRQAALVEACRPFVNDSTAVRRLREGGDVMYSAVQYTTIAGVTILWRPQ